MDMGKEIENQPHSHQSVIIRKCYAVLLVTGLLFAAYLLYHHTAVTSGFQLGPSICKLDEHFDCDAVAASSYSELFGIPIASYAILYYLALSAILRLWKIDDKSRFSVLLFLSLLSILPTAVLFVISATIIHKFCLFCLLLGLVNFALIIVGARFPDNHSLVARVVCGAKLTVLYFAALTGLDGGRWNGRAKALFSFCCFLFTFVFIYFLPVFLIELVFVPSISGDISSAESRRLFKDWLQADSKDLMLSLNSGQEEKDFSYGPADAKVTIVEFSDFECPHCKNAAFLLKRIIADYASVRFVMKNFPLDSSCNRAMKFSHHKFACLAAKMARCAGRNGDQSFWKMYYDIFSLPLISESNLSALQQQAELSEPSYRECIAGNSAKKRIEQDVELGFKLGINATPAIYINGKQLAVAEPGAIRLILNYLLAAN